MLLLLQEVVSGVVALFTPRVFLFSTEEAKRKRTEAEWRHRAPEQLEGGQRWRLRKQGQGEQGAESLSRGQWRADGQRWQEEKR